MLARPLMADATDKRALTKILGRGAKKVLPRAIVRLLQRVTGRPPHQVPIGSVRFGDLSRLSPISRGFGSDRGTPIDRYYIESFLDRNAGDIHGRVLEIGDDRYTRLGFGGDRVERSDILSVEASNPKATFVGDLTQSNILPEAAFDCIVLTQVLQYIFDLPAAVEVVSGAEAWRNSTVTAPSIRSQTDGSEWGATWYWWFTPQPYVAYSMDRFSHVLTVDTYGNIFVATAFTSESHSKNLNPYELDASETEIPCHCDGPRDQTKRCMKHA